MIADEPFGVYLSSSRTEKDHQMLRYVLLGQEALGLSESERTSSEEPRAAVSVCQTMVVLDTAYGILYDFLWEVCVLVLDGLREDP